MSWVPSLGGTVVSPNVDQDELIAVSCCVASDSKSRECNLAQMRVRVTN